MKVRTDTLSDRALDYAVAVTEGVTDEWRSDGPFFWDDIPCIRIDGRDVEYRPSDMWLLCGPLFEAALISTAPKWHNAGYDTPTGYWEWEAHHLGPDNIDESYEMIGPSLRVAGLRCLVRMKLGEEVEIPNDLL